ncbi:hypothetical protein EW146_g4954 [Bondarzewia mesenterica]|uniref:PQ-loop repeat-containing protein n=1 Tax=Bondarzewia mesenterica TaxID=1095465 RepID=A0A4S4LV21_9AGAM|nr:hypothetical protein EW146_g4954 [Bondarzewia mesenterica]
MPGACRVCRNLLSSSTSTMSGTCQPAHDWFSDLLSGGIIVGLFISYAPQHLRIINKGSSEGFSPWFLLLGSTSGASGMFNMIVMQWGVLKCCRVYSFGNCLETIAGVLQVIVQWFLFTVILALYMIYYPSHLKYVTVAADTHDTRPSSSLKKNIKTHNWWLSIVLSWVVFIHIVLITFITFLLVSTSPSDPSGTIRSEQLSHWATFLGLASAALAALQYAPQLVHTYRHKLVGALSIPMMLIQTPGGFIIVLSIALQPGTNWTSWLQFLVAAIMQAVLLGMCITWKYRQHALGIDDFGHPLLSSASIAYRTDDEDVPVEEAIQAAFAEDIVIGEGESERSSEQTPLLGKAASEGTKKRWWPRWV